MTHMVTLISAKGGVGKSMLTANLAALLAGKNKRVAMLDADITSPSLHHFFDLKINEPHTFRDYIEDRCGLDEVTHAVTDRIQGAFTGDLDLIQVGGASSISDSWFGPRWAEKIFAMNECRNYDYLLVDTQAGFARQDALLLGTMSREVLVILKADQQDYHGTELILAALNLLEVSEVSLVVNQVVPVYDFDQVQGEIEASLKVNVQAILPMSEDVSGFGSAGLFVVMHPYHGFTQRMQLLASSSIFRLD